MGMQAVWALALNQICEGCLPTATPPLTLKTCFDFCRPLALANPAAFALFSAAFSTCGVQGGEQAIRLAVHRWRRKW